MHAMGIEVLPYKSVLGGDGKALIAPKIVPDNRGLNDTKTSRRKMVTPNT
jgi:hypothetical protein